MTTIEVILPLILLVCLVLAGLAALPALVDQISFAFPVNQPFTREHRWVKVVVIQKKY